MTALERANFIMHKLTNSKFKILWDKKQAGELTADDFAEAVDAMYERAFDLLLYEEQQALIDELKDGLALVDLSKRTGVEIDW